MDSTSKWSRRLDAFPNEPGSGDLGVAGVRTTALFTAVTLPHTSVIKLAQENGCQRHVIQAHVRGVIEVGLVAP